MDAAHPGVDVLEHHLLNVTALLTTRVVQVVGVHDANHMVELIGPALAVVVPVKVLRLLQHRHIRLVVRDAAGDVTHRQDAAFFSCISAGVECDLEVTIQAGAAAGPVTHIRLLVLWRLKPHVPGEHTILIWLAEPWQHQRDLARAVRGKVGCTQEGVDSCSSEPWERCSGDNGHLTPWIADALLLHAISGLLAVKLVHVVLQRGDPVMVVVVTAIPHHALVVR
mmetsp:Transcript_8747/g.18659  ORF Transcript_8747/g.18659 Transcript_8747/m.18659 type:complete len:224 (-) Transcript_8747:1058-1729(-)